MKYLFLLLLAGCATHVPNVPLCINEPANQVHAQRGFCNYTLEDKAFYVDDDKQLYTDSKGKKWKWSELQMISLVTPPDTWVSLSAFIQSYCHRKPGDCGQDVGQWTNSEGNILTDVQKTSSKAQYDHVMKLKDHFEKQMQYNQKVLQ